MIFSKTKNRFIFLFTLLFLSTACGVDKSLLEYDLQRLFGVKNITIVQVNSKNKNTVHLTCENQKVYFFVKSIESEFVSTLYTAIHKMGFLFPHPRVSIAPKGFDINRFCNKSWSFEPSISKRGFHLHTQHPNEWVSGFFMDQEAIAQDFIWWLARNRQNVMQIVLLKKSNLERLNDFFKLAKDLGIETGISVSFGMIQQKSYKLLDLWQTMTGFGVEQALEKSTNDLVKKINFDYLATDLGTSEFTPTSYIKTIDWMNYLAKTLKSKNKRYMVKIHASTNQVHKDFGNYNFLPQYAEADVGVQPHTVFFYGLKDSYAPMYGRSDFYDMKDFMLEQNKNRQTWYFPETSYWVGMDMDIPLFLTDYLHARTEDYKFVSEAKINGHINFTSGQEVGYWLFDWNLTLQSDADYLGDSLIAIKLLGEDSALWKKIIDWQKEHLKEKQIIQMISSSNLMDELSPLFEKIHERYLLRELFFDSNALKKQIEALDEAILKAPEFDKIKNAELRIMNKLTYLRLKHSKAIRLFLLDSEKYPIEQASQIRQEALEMIKIIIQEHNRYPESFTFDQFINPTSYQYGYLWPIRDLHFWQREEEIVKNKVYNPFFMNIYKLFDILL